MNYNPGIHHRKSIRLKHYDYSQNGFYFITMCTKNRQLLFEKTCVRDMVEKWWFVLPSKFTNVDIDEFVVMPNHIHGIIVLVGTDQRDGWVPFPGKLWQRNYYEHIICDDYELNVCRDYIKNNPFEWHVDINNLKKHVKFKYYDNNLKPTN